jgi:hypothetical protein
MEMITAIAISLTLGAMVIAKESEVSMNLKHYYAALTRLIKGRYPQV